MRPNSHSMFVRNRCPYGMIWRFPNCLLAKVPSAILAIVKNVFNLFIRNERICESILIHTCCVPNLCRCQLIIREGVRDVDEIPAPPEAIVDFSRLLTMRKTTAGATTNPVPSFSDVTFRLDGTEFECHKAIVSRKSPILKEFFIAYVS